MKSGIIIRVIEVIHVVKVMQNTRQVVGKKWIYADFYRYRILVSYIKSIIEFRDHELNSAVLLGRKMMPESVKGLSNI